MLYADRRKVKDCCENCHLETRFHRFEVLERSSPKWKFKLRIYDKVVCKIISFDNSLSKSRSRFAEKLI